MNQTQVLCEAAVYVSEVCEYFCLSFTTCQAAVLVGRAGKFGIFLVVVHVRTLLVLDTFKRSTEKHITPCNISKEI